MIFTRDFVTRENYWQIASLVTQKSLFTVTHALFFISRMYEYYSMLCSVMNIFNTAYVYIGISACTRLP